MSDPIDPRGAAPEAPRPAVSRAPGEPALLRALIDALPVGVTVKDAQGDRVFANAAADALALAEHASETLETLLTHGADTLTVTTSLDLQSHRRQLDELFERAYLDELTGLPNRALCEQTALELIAGVAPGERFGLAFIDLDNFKHINDFYSHAAGDAVLVRVAERVSSLLRPQDVLARIGGDEFVLFLTPVADEAELQDRLGAIAELLRRPVFVDGHEIFATASMGAALYPDHGITYDTLRRNADSAMYRIKSGIKGGVAIFDETMSLAATGRMAIEQRFRLAVRDRRFCCAYQPKVDIGTQEVIGLEVLLRWRDEEGVIQAPGHFVGLAIELGLINEITHLMLAEVMDSLPVLDSMYGANISLSINIAAKQAEDIAFMEGFIQALEATGCPERFMLELTEEAFFTKSLFQTRLLPALRAIGTKVSIDDFGAGYSSLSALAEIEADEIKIDRSFITDIHKRPRSQIVLKGIESLGRALGMTIIAEGIETFEELVWIRASTSIHHAQGYYFSKPAVLPDEDATRFDLDGRRQAFAREVAAARQSLLRTG